ncbi:MAG: PEP-CTERM sorting domain-containing protein [Candidatus Omnitrophica bacterium]|nr:PEP-CTERM sorting domain-containing protein [Candidatus Omnitrophota bacterium]
MKRVFLILITLLFFTVPTTASAATVGLWLFDEGIGGTAYDSSVYGNHGTLGGEVSDDEPAWTAGKYGSALYFDGVNDWLNCGTGASLDIAGDMTIEFWMKPQDWYRYDGTYTTIIMKGDNSGNKVTYNVGHPNSGGHGIKFAYYNSGWVNVNDTSGVSYTMGEWYHMAVVVDEANDNVKFYRDGTLLSSISNDFGLKPMLSNDAPLVMGRFSQSVEWYQGALDEVRISDTALSRDDLGYGHSFVPEPATMIMLGSLAVGLYGMTGSRKRFIK